MIRIGIIGGGFSGTMTAVQLIYQATNPISIALISEKEYLNRGFAYSPYSKKHILNVVAEKMSAFPDKPNDFMDWVMAQEDMQGYDRTLIANSFLPRYMYGNYLVHVWEQAKKVAQEKGIELQVVESFVLDIDLDDQHVEVLLDNSDKLVFDKCIVTSGNQVPRNPAITNMAFYQSKNYFQNPWLKDSVMNIKRELPVLILGNGLTMVDTVFGLLEQGYKGQIYAVSPNGFNILPHRHNGLKYSKLTEELKDDMSLFDLLKLVNKHVKLVREYGVSAEPVIDSIRPFTQNIWKRLSDEEKKIFMARFRHLWGVARHRIPLHSHDKIQQLRINNKLVVQSGKLIDIEEAADQHIQLTYLDKKDKQIKKLEVCRVINCTGPESNLMLMENTFLKSALLKGYLKQDPLFLGIVTDTDSYQIISKDGIKQSNLYTIGSSLRGELWETTAVNELRSQAEKLARQILNEIKEENTSAKGIKNPL